MRFKSVLNDWWLYCIEQFDCRCNTDSSNSKVTYRSGFVITINVKLCRDWKTLFIRVKMAFSNTVTQILLQYKPFGYCFCIWSHWISGVNTYNDTRMFKFKIINSKIMRFNNATPIFQAFSNSTRNSIVANCSHQLKASNWLEKQCHQREKVYTHESVLIALEAINSKKKREKLIQPQYNCINSFVTFSIGRYMSLCIRCAVSSTARTFHWMFCL